MDPINSSNIIQNWSINSFEVRLFNNNNQLKYETVDTIDGSVVYQDSVILNSGSPEQMIPFLKNSRIRIGEKGNVIFLQNIQAWSLDNYVVNLTRGADELIWNIFCNSVKNSSFHPLRESTIPSGRCHPETVAMIDKIIKESFKDKRNRDTLTQDFKVVRVLDTELYNEECLNLKKM